MAEIVYNETEHTIIMMLQFVLTIVQVIAMYSMWIALYAISWKTNISIGILVYILDASQISLSL